MIDQHYPVKDVASRLSCSEETVRRMIRSGVISAIKLGRDYRVSEKSLALTLKSSPKKIRQNAT